MASTPRLILATTLTLCGACGGGDGGGVDAALATCEDYCAEITNHCAGDNTQYVSRDQCEAVCAAFPQGEPGAQNGNSLECRAYHAGAALGDPDTHCTHAGPGGDSLCGSNCDGFCAVVLHACTGGDEVYASGNECITACGGFDDSEPYDSGDVAGDTLACRLYHATVATQDPAVHCEHTAPASATCQ